MKKFSFKVLISMVIFLIVLGVLSALLFKELLGSITLNIISSIIAGIFIWVFGKLSKNKELLFLEANLFLKHKNEKIRMSMSYIFKIKVNDKYLLVKGKYKNYQPVGGVYKYYSDTELRDLGFSTNSGSVLDNATKNDLRITIPAMNVIKFLDWFFSCKDREVDVYREFHEELIVTGILPDNFGIISYRFLGFNISKLHYSKYFKTNELLCYNLYELMPTPEQNKILLSTIETTDENFKWVTRKRDKARI